MPESRLPHSPASHVFLSYASQDAEAAKKVCAALEGSGQRCWIAPRDVRAGESYAVAIVEAINSCRMLVLMFSGSAIGSPHVMREVERATSKRRSVLTIRLDDSALPPELEYFLSAHQWLDAQGSRIDAIVPALVAAVRGQPAEVHADTMPAAARSASARFPAARASRAFIALAVLAVAGTVAWRLTGSGQHSVATTPPAGTTAQQPATIARSTVSPGAISIAVLPFVNLSSDKEQEFFSDGMTEEITSALAKVPNLRVVARTSAFEFKGQNRDVQTIAQALHATHVIEGSVRKDGNQVRITAQLIEASDGTHLWTESYDRELKGVFAVQEEIAQAIAGALRVPLGLQQGETLVSNRTDDVESYQQYLRARALYRARAVDQAIALLEPAVARNPNYAPAWALLSQAYAISPAYNTNVWAGPIGEVRPKVQSALDKAERAAREALRLDPRHAGGYVALGNIQTNRGNWVAGDDLFRQALALDSDDPDALQLYSLALGALGRVKQALSLREQLRTLEPFVPVYNVFYAYILQLNGQSEATTPLLETIPPGAANAFRNIFLAKAYAAAGRYGDAADTLLALPADTTAISRRSVEDAARLLRSAPAKAGPPGALPALEYMGFVYAYAGAPNRFMERPERLLEIGYLISPPTWAIWEPLNAPLRKTERFKAFVRKAGLLDYWRTKGWPDLCRPVGANDFACD